MSRHRAVTPHGMIYRRVELGTVRFDMGKRPDPKAGRFAWLKRLVQRRRDR